MLKGKRLSILGDSVSTYYGVSNDIKANAEIGGNPSYYFKRHFPVESAYWHIVLDKYGMTLCVNNSFSGGNLSGRDNPCSGVNRVSSLSRDTGEAPDLIIVFMGLNDLGRNVDINVFRSDYLLTLERIKEKYKGAKVCCVNMPIRPEFMVEGTRLINSVIDETVCKMGEGFFVARLSDHVFKDYNDFYMNTLDGLHPDPDGMRIIANAVIWAIERYL